MRRLAQSPLMGHLREDLTDETVCFWSVYSYVIVDDPPTMAASDPSYPSQCP